MGVHTQAFGDGTGQLWAQYQGRTRHGAEEREKHLEAAGHIRVLHCICKDLERLWFRLAKEEFVHDLGL